MSVLAKIGRTYRTIQHLRRTQAVAEIRFRLLGLRPPQRRSQSQITFSGGTLETPFLAPATHIRWLGGGHLEMISQVADFSDGINWGSSRQGPLWAYHLHECAHLRATSLSPARRTAYLLDWIQSQSRGIGWNPHPTSLRILNWGKLLLSQDELELDSDGRTKVISSMAQQLDSLSANLEIRLQANHLLSNLVGLVFGGLLFEGEEADCWLRHRSRLCEELALQFGDEGAHEERSPMYQSLLLEQILDLLNLARARPGRVPPDLTDRLEETASRGLGALEVLSHADGDIALFGDSALGIAQPVGTLRSYGMALGVDAKPPDTPQLLKKAGYAKLSGGDLTLLCSVAGPGPDHQPGHAHCDALAFELTWRQKRIVTDTGVYEYVAGDRRQVSRSTRSHSTMVVGDQEQAEIWAAHRVGGRPEVRLAEFDPERGRLEATCRAWCHSTLLHRRIFLIQDRAIQIRDSLSGGQADVCFALPLAPGLDPRLLHDVDGGAEAHIALSEGVRLRVALPVAADWCIERTPYFPTFGRVQDRACLIGRAVAFESGTWQFDLVES